MKNYNENGNKLNKHEEYGEKNICIGDFAESKVGIVIELCQFNNGRTCRI